MGKNNFICHKDMLLTLYPNGEVAATLKRPSPPKPEKKVPREFVIPRGGDAPPELLDLASQPSQPIPRKGFKRHPMSKPAKHKILKLGGLFLPENRSNQVFLTGTLPGSSEAAVSEFSRLAPRAIKFFLTYLPRELGLSAKDLDYLWVWELQRRGALHIHCLIEFPSPGDADRCVEMWGGVWRKILLGVAGVASLDIFERRFGGSWADRPDIWQSDAALVKKSASRYLSKYVSKGSNSPKSSLFPPRWYGASSSLREKYLQFIRSHSVFLRLDLPGGVESRSLGEYVSDVLRSVCSGAIGSRCAWDNVRGFSVYGYLQDSVPWDSVVSLVSEAVLPFLADNAPKVPRSRALPPLSGLFSSISRVVSSSFSPANLESLSRGLGSQAVETLLLGLPFSRELADDVIHWVGYLTAFDAWGSSSPPNSVDAFRRLLRNV